jgi:hypothetical protein
MIESTIINKLTTDSVLMALLHDGANSVFTENAPEDESLPYLLVRLHRTQGGFKPLQEFTLYVEFIDYNVSRVNSRVAAERIEFDLDDWNLQHERYGDIHIHFFSGSDVGGEDPRDIHQILQFQCQGIRKKWINETKT